MEKERRREKKCSAGARDTDADNRSCTGVRVRYTNGQRISGSIAAACADRRFFCRARERGAPEKAACRGKGREACVQRRRACGVWRVAGARHSLPWRRAPGGGAGDGEISICNRRNSNGNSSGSHSP